MLVLGVTFVQNSHTHHVGPSGPHFWPLATITVVVTVVVATLTVRNHRDFFFAILLGLGMCAAAGVCGALIGWPLAVVTPVDFVGIRAFVVLLLGLLTFLGLWLLFRQSSWRGSLPWLLPALLPFIPGLLPAVGLSLPTVYLGEFDVDVEDVQLSMLAELRSAFHVLAAISLWLIAPALLGLAKHLHLMVRDRWMSYAAFVLFSGWCLLIGAWQLAYVPAVSAGTVAEMAAAYGEGSLANYGAYGIQPEWVCVRPIVAPNKVPSTGGELDPAQPYVSLGDAEGIAVLWAPADHRALKVPLASLRLLPTDDSRRGSCDRSIAAG
ncbi:hypothetical protein [Streptomyces sp. SP2-10]|uniref:hypothetical protein n=1 Tax=Streptomyces sp. SP2-10 TaxID=2873385 RepID=UPI001CA768D2|nr:hypothetical protein [Streptomyces sp. SP2-10]MBY8841216.1 hypothetical protein [Streptomyces sp. SP2-10]